MAYNLLSPATTTSMVTHADYPSTGLNRGRRGAAKIVILETDGVPNAHQNWSLQKFGYESYYTTSTGSGSQTYDGNGASASETAATNVIDQIVKNAATVKTSGTDSGYSYPSTPAKVWVIGFGDLFSGTPAPDFQDDALAFLLTCSQKGGTVSSSASSMPTDQIITGTYDNRITGLRSILERIMQSGVQVALIE
jgi:hypothetical protein